MISKEKNKLAVIGYMLLGAVLILFLRFHPSARSVVVDFMAPFLENKKGIEDRVKGSSLFQQSKIELIQQNKELSNEVKRLRAKLEAQSRIKLDNDELRRIFQLGTKPDYQFLIAEILSWDPANGGSKVRVNRGYADSVRVGFPVLVNGYFYGRIVEVSDHTSLVLSIIDPNCKVSVRIKGTNIHGITVGQDRERWRVYPRCLIKFLPRDYNYTEGLEIETSGLGNDIPPSLPVGVLATDRFGNVTRTVDDLYKVGYLKQIDSESKFNYVMIIKR